MVLALLTAVGCAKKDGRRELELGRAAMESRELSKARDFFSKSLKYAPGSVDALVGLAQCSLALGDIDAAGKAMTEALALRPGDVDVRLLDAEVAWHRKDYGKAKRVFREVAQDASLEPQVRSQGWSSLGVVEFAEGNLDLARIAFLRAVRIDRRNAAAWYHLGLLYRDYGYSHAALEQFEIYVRISDDLIPGLERFP